MIIDLTRDEVQTMLVIIDVCQRGKCCKVCGNNAQCDSVWKKLAAVNS